MIKSTRLLIAFWVLMIIGLLYAWQFNDYPFGGSTDFTVGLIVFGLIMGLTTALYVLWVRRIVKRPRRTALYIILGLWPIIAFFTTGFIITVILHIYFDFTTLIPFSLYWTWFWLYMIMGSMIIMGSLVYQAYRTKKDNKLLRNAAKVSAVGMFCLVLILVLHALIPGPAVMALNRYLTANHETPYTITNTEWYHFCCMEKRPVISQYANEVIFTVKVPTDGVSTTKYFVMGDTNPANDVATFGSQIWSTPTEVAPGDIDTYRADY